VVSNKKISGISYAKTDNGVELPILDITHPLFVSILDETALDALGKEALKQAKSMQKNSIIKFLASRSLTLGGFRPTDKNAHYVSGMSTLMMKLGRAYWRGNETVYGSQSLQRLYCGNGKDASKGHMSSSERGVDA
jgi:hypothetical protein